MVIAASAVTALARRARVPKSMAKESGGKYRESVE